MDRDLTAALITIGDEILIGQIVNTNATHLSLRLTELGYSVKRIISVGDDAAEIKQTVDRYLNEFDVVITTGGLGPTHDDITKTVLMDLFGGTWIKSEEQFAIIVDFFEKRGRTVTPINEMQADIPSTSQALINDAGTAPGLWFSRTGHDLFVLPGVPKEMKFLMDERIVPILKDKNTGRYIVQRTLRTTNIGESALGEQIGPVSEFLPSHATLAFLPSFSGVRLRVMLKGNNKPSLEKDLDRICNFLIEKSGTHFYGTGDEDLEEAVLSLLKNHHKTLSVAESITGGLIGDKITNIPGASSVFMAGFITYSNEAKITFLGVKPETLAGHGAVSEPVAAEMAVGARQKTGTDYGLSITGIAGPTGATETKPVGLVFIGVSSAEKTEVRKLHLSGDRKVIKERATFSALNFLREFVLQDLKL